MKNDPDFRSMVYDVFMLPAVVIGFVVGCYVFLKFIAPCLN